MADGVCVLKGSALRKKQCDSKQSKEISQLTAVIDKMGEASAKVRPLFNKCAKQMVRPKDFHR